MPRSNHHTEDHMIDQESLDIEARAAAAQAYADKYGDGREHRADPDVPCPECGGEGFVSGWPEGYRGRWRDPQAVVDVPCPECEGAGTVPA